MQPGITSVPDPPAQKWATKAVTAPASVAVCWEQRAADLVPLPGATWVVVSSGFVVLWQRQILSNPDNFTSLNLEESACLSRLRSGRNLIPNQHKSKQISCL